MSKRSNVKAIDVNTLVVNREVNFRDDYDLPSMMDEIIKAGRVLEPVHVRKEDNVVLKGNRRVASCQELLKNPSIPADLKESIMKIDVIFYEGLTEKETTEIVLDHGSQKPLSRVEVVKAIWRLVRQMYSFSEICVIMYHLVARFTGNVKKAHEAEALPPGPARTEFLKKWLKGTVDDYLINAAGLGDYVRSQVILTEMRADRKLTTEEEKQLEMVTNRDRINKLRSARVKDEKENGGWSPEKGGKEFNALIQKFKDEDAGKVTEETTKRPTAKMMEQAADQSSSSLGRLIYKHCAGATTEAEKNSIINLDAEMGRRDKIFEFARQNLDRINKSAKFSGGEVHEVLRLILDGAPQNFAEYVTRFNQ